MGVLLNDEKIINLVTEYHFSNIKNRHILAKSVAKAQLKKVVEIHKGIIETDDSEEVKLLKIQEFWVALLKEIE